MKYIISVWHFLFETASFSQSVVNGKKIEIVKTHELVTCIPANTKKKKTLIVFYMVLVKKDGYRKKFMDPLNI
jgi:hypothetical protein